MNLRWVFFTTEITGERQKNIIENPRTIGEHLKKRRQELGLYQTEVAKTLGVTPDTVTYWENGRFVPQIQSYPKIIAFLGYNPFAREEKSIGGQIFKYRTEQGLSFKQLAKYTGNDPATLARWEQTRSVPSTWEKMKLIALGLIS